MGRGLGRPLLRLGLITVVSAVAASVGDVGDFEEHVGEIGGVLLVVGDTSSVWKSSFTSWSDFTYGIKETSQNSITVNNIDFLLFNDLLCTEMQAHYAT